MIKPSYDEVLNLKDNYSVIPIYKEIYADAFTPINLLRKIAGKSDKFFLLESIEGGEKWARYSFIGFNPKARLSYKNGTLTVTGEGARVVKTAKPYDALRKYLADYKTPHFKDIPPFTGGLVGYFGYAMISVAEPVLKLKRGDTNDFDMMLFDKIIAYDHLKEKLIIIVNMKTNDTKAQYELAKKDIAEIISTITSPEPLPKLESDGNVEFTSTYSKEEFCKMVEKTKDQTEVGTVEGRNKHLRISHGQLLYDVLPGYFVCCCSQCDNRYIGKLLAEHFQLCIFRTEIMSPLGNAVSFINGKKRNTDILQQKIQFRKEPFGRDIKEFYPSLHTFETQIGVDRFIVAAVQGTGDDSVGLQTFHLVFHE